MSQQQVQYRPSGVNGVSRRRMDRDLRNRGETYRADFQTSKSLPPIRSGSSLPNAGVSSHHLYSHVNNVIVSHITGPRSSGERGEVLGLGGSRGALGRPLYDRLLFMTACLVGQPVEVQVKNGSIYAGIFHTANAEKDYGIILKMARVTKDGFVKEGKSEALKDAARKAPVKTLIIHANDLVQITAKDVPLSGNSLLNSHSHENRSDIVKDAILPQRRHLELERELKPWTPDKDDPKDLGLESTFQNTWNRNWDQFETNKALFGVESTFDEELYTTKLERGPQMRELEREAWRIAREIEGETTTNFHLAEERGAQLSKELEAMDEESRYSSVIRQDFMDIGEDNEDGNVDTCNEETFGTAVASFGADLVTAVDSKMYVTSELVSKKSWSQSADSNQVGGSPYHSPVGIGSPLMNSLIFEPTSIQALNLEPGRVQVTEDIYREFNEFKQQENAKRGKKQREEQLNELKSFSESLRDLTKDLEPQSPKSAGATQARVGECTPPASALPFPTGFDGSIATASTSEMASSALTQSLPTTLTNSLKSTKVLARNSVEWHSVVMTPVVTQLHPPSAIVLASFSSSSSEMTASISNSVSTFSSATPKISSPLSSPTTLTKAASTKKSHLDLNAKEFKLNPNAKVFTPSITSVRSPSSVVQAPIYIPGTVPVPIQAMPVGIGVSPLMQQPGQSAKYAQYNSLPATAATASTPFLKPAVTYTPGVSGGVMPPSLPGQPTIKMPLQAQQPISGHSLHSQQLIRFTSQGPPVQPSPAYVHPNGQLYSQQMMIGQPGQVFYIQPFPQEMIQGPSTPSHQLAQLASQQAQLPKYLGGGVQGMQLCLAPPFLSGQQHFIQQPHMPHLQNSVQPTSGVLAPTSMPAIQPAQGMMAGMVPIVQNSTPLSAGNAMWIGGKVVGGNIQKQ